MNHENIRFLITQSEQYLASCNESLDEDKLVEIEGFEKMVVNLCEELGGLPLKDAKIYENSIQNILSGLNDLSENLVKKRDDVKQQIHEINAHANASNAYQNSDS